MPDVNEPNYLGKAIHFWNPAWAPNDFFLDTADTHWVFYFTFGWLSRWLAADGVGMDRPRADLGPAGLGVAAIELRRGAAGVAGAGDGRLVRGA